LDHAIYQGSVTENYQSAISYLKSHLNTEYVIKDGPREEILELPEEALREALLNALAHRDYRSTSDIQVHIFHDRIEISNPGGLVSGLRLKDLGRVSRPRNLLLFSLMARMDLVEHIGSGIKRIREAVASYGLEPPTIEANSEWFAVTFWRKGLQEAIKKTPSLRLKGGQPGGVNGGVNEGAGGGVSEGVENLLELIRRTPGLRAPKIAAVMKLPVKTVDKWLNQLKGKADIEFRGGARTGGYWAKKEQGGGVSGGVNGGVSGGVNEGLENLLGFIRRTPGLRTPQISKAVGVPVSTLEKWLKKLKDKGRIVFKGSPKSGGYRITQ